MNYRTYIIERMRQNSEKLRPKDITVKSFIHHKGEEHEAEFDLPYAKAANAVMSAAGYSEYIKKHGYHFTEELAELVSGMMENANEQKHSWTAAQVKDAMAALGLELSNKVTLGDVTYLANMYYADMYPEYLTTEDMCIKAAHSVASDPDGYNGMVFCRWTADAIGNAISLDWEEYV